MKRLLFSIALLLLAAVGASGLCKIEAGELSVVLLCGLVIGVGSVFQVIKVSQMSGVPIYHNLRQPFLAALAPRSALESGTVLSVDSLVPHVFCMRAFTQIIFSIVDSVVIFVVNLFSWSTSKYDSVHYDRALFSRKSLSVKTINLFIPDRAPIPLIEPVVVGRINNGSLPLRERDQLVRWVGRLSNRVPLHSAFWHGLTSSKVLQLSHFIIGAV